MTEAQININFFLIHKRKVKVISKMLQKNKFVDFSMSMGMLIVLKDRPTCCSLMVNLSTMKMVKFGLEMDRRIFGEKDEEFNSLCFVHWKRITSRKYQEDSWRYEDVQEENV